MPTALPTGHPKAHLLPAALPETGCGGLKTMACACCCRQAAIPSFGTGRKIVKTNFGELADGSGPAGQGVSNVKTNFGELADGFGSAAQGATGISGISLVQAPTRPQI